VFACGYPSEVRDPNDDKLKLLRDLHRAGTGPGASVKRADVVHESLLAELREEMAAALGRAGDKVTRALEDLAEAEHTLDAPPAGGEADLHQWEVYEACYARAERALWQLRVHREALGLLRHDPLQWLFPLPPKRKRA